jgi:GNAT superfamily N-acetyltransferase
MLVADPDAVVTCDLHMDVEITEEPMSTLAEHGSIGIAFVVQRVLDLEIVDGGFGGFALRERAIEVPYIKDYDIDGGGPETWAEAIDLSNWGLLVARSNGRRVGGAVLAFDTQGISMLRGLRDLMVLWDLRVASEARQAGVGSRLFRAAEAWAVARGCRQLEVETQNVNLPACRFYARQGCILGAIDRYAYPDLPEEFQMLWHKDLAPP